jgi:hypothetical protein
MKVRSWMDGFAVMALFTAGSAFAAIDASRVDDDLKFNEEKTKVGLDAHVGAGGFTGIAGDLTAPGGLLGLTAVAQPWRNLGLEAGFEGQRLPIDDDRVGDDQALYRYNVDVMAKAGPLLLKDVLRPYVGASVGLTYVNVTDDADILYRNDFIEELGGSAGLDFLIGPNLAAGARATYQILLGTEFADPATGTGETGGNLLNFAATVGGRF